MADLSITAANVGVHDSGALTQIVQAGESVTQGNPVYLNSAKYYQCDADAGASNAVCAGIAITPADADGYFVMATPSANTILDLGATLVVGTIYVLSGTKGAIAPSADLASGDYVTTLGIATAADKLVLDIQVSGVAVP